MIKLGEAGVRLINGAWLDILTFQKAVKHFILTAISFCRAAGGKRKQRLEVGGYGLVPTGINSKGASISHKARLCLRGPADRERAEQKRHPPRHHPTHQHNR